MSRPFRVPPVLTVSLHGWPRLACAGVGRALGLRHGLALLAYLLCSGQRVARERAAALLWPAADARTARTRLRRLVYALNAGCGAEVVAADGEALWIDTDAVRIECDVLRAQAQARAQIAPQGDGEATDALLAPGAEGLLEGFDSGSAAFDEWLAQQRQAHLRLVAHGLQRLAQRSVAFGRLERAIEAAERAIALEPHAERGYAELMIALGHRGDAGAVEAAYFRCAGVLREEYGVAPSGIVETAYASAMALSRGAARAAPAGAGSPAQVRYTHGRDGVRLAYAVSGDGPCLIKAANWLSHLAYDDDSPVWSHMVRALTRGHTCVRYDERGCGLSDWEVADLSFARWVDDLEAVVDALDAPRFALLGISQGASIAIAYAVRHPGRVSHLVLHGGYARGRLVRSDTPQEREEAETMAKLAELGWGKAEPSFRQFFTSQFIPDGSAQQHEWFNELERLSTSPANAARFMREFALIDVVDLLPHVRCPTLVLHSRDDVRVPVAEGRLVAERIPGARFVTLHSRNHLLLEHEAAWPHWLEEVSAFLAR
ncbi:alpha/beta fold hydrolase [Luteimonas saliphila]|uniref:alpha/beta fold hydrolase n=1 Tax=Luteimonas saliphila TaxID=2804919 RepID=UPI00192E0B36|nr:alpha/beta fold hydrolase [Luteimonas saliphila]